MHDAAQKSRLTTSLFTTVALFAVFTVAAQGLLPCPAIDDAQRRALLEERSRLRRRLQEQNDLKREKSGSGQEGNEDKKVVVVVMPRRNNISINE
ncbi:4788_t:CDS:2 [Ambispora gerdemannii]|uniref:4788_t:CDS:1 n=1 Tax=Ambispora gerdemannii TaxID=144530 RepID=A0A9N8V1M0_9GLOM|nr:4788_t:CDS:2 [Ambispora gerdemannii]